MDVPAKFAFKEAFIIDQIGHGVLIDKEGIPWVGPAIETIDPSNPIDTSNLQLVIDCICQGASFGEDVTFLEYMRPFLEQQTYNNLMNQVCQYHNNGEIENPNTYKIMQRNSYIKVDL